MAWSMKRSGAILEFWFKDTSEDKWFAKDSELDLEIRQKFLDDYRIVVSEGIEIIKEDARQSLAAIILLDQFARNMFRGEAKAFAADRIALQLARHAIAVGHDAKFPDNERAFFYMPLMHAEERGALNECVMAFTRLGDQNFLQYAHAHKDIIDRFGRYPHRNDVLGRESTADEVEFMKEHSGF